MKYSQLKASIVAQLTAPEGHKVAFYVRSSPGTGKSTLMNDIAHTIQQAKGIPDERVVVINPSLREPSDFLGLPDLHGEVTRWVPPEDLYRIRKGQGPSILQLEELSDADMSVQNPLCRMILDRCAGSMPLSEELYILCTGNRTEDRSGANRLSTKLGNRMRVLDFDVSVDEWLEWADTHNVPTTVRMFIAWDKPMLNAFDPKKDINPTPRSWADVARIPFDDPAFTSAVCAEHVRGAVGEEAAAKFIGFLNLYKNLPNFDDILSRPDKAKVPNDPQTQFVIVARIVDVIKNAEKVAAAKMWEKYWVYLKRLPVAELRMLAVENGRRANPAILRTKAWREFCAEFGDACFRV